MIWISERLIEFVFIMKPIASVAKHILLQNVWETVILISRKIGHTQ